MRNEGWEIAILKCINSLGGKAYLKQAYENIDKFIQLTGYDKRSTNYGGRPAFEHQVRSHISNLCEKNDLQWLMRGYYMITERGRRRIAAAVPPNLPQAINRISPSTGSAVRETTKVILLATNWRSDLFDIDGEAPYLIAHDETGNSILIKGFRPEVTIIKWPPKLKEWEKLSENVPLAGLGIYIKEKAGKRNYSSIPFVYLQIRSIRYDENTKKLIFGFRASKKSHLESKELTRRLPRENIKLYSIIDANIIIRTLLELSEEPPAGWIQK